MIPELSRFVAPARSAKPLAILTLCGCASLAAFTAALLGPAACAAEPSAPLDHATALESLSLAESEAFAELIAGYDHYLAEHPRDVQAQVERCRFLGGASCDDDDERCPYWDEYELCLDGLEARFPGAAPVHLLRLETLWGDEAIQLGQSLLEGHAQSWMAADVARVHEKLAKVYDAQDESKPSLVLAHARQAMDLDPAIDLTLEAAGALRTLGKRHEAVQMLVSLAPDTKNVWRERQKIELLLDLDAYPEAAQALAQLGTPPESTPDHLLEARVWSSVGRVDEARSALDSALADPSAGWKKRKILEQRQLLESQSGDAGTALAAYDALRENIGYFGDPLRRTRVRLAFQHPSTPWRARDSADLLGLLLLLSIVALGVGALLVPIHYVGLIRERRRASGPTPLGRFGLRHCWYALVVILFASLPMLYLDGVDWLSEIGRGRTFSFAHLQATPLPQSSAALGGVMIIGVEWAGLALLLRRGDLRLFRRGSWSMRKTGIVVAGALLLLQGSLRLYASFFPELIPGDARTSLSAASDLPLISEIARAIAQLYGLPVLLIFLSVAVPIGEEFVFRGVLLQGFGHYLPAWLANFLQATLFAGMHDQLALFPFFLLFGLICGAIARRSQSLQGSILLHAANNAIAFVIIARALPPH